MPETALKEWEVEIGFTGSDRVAYEVVEAPDRSAAMAAAREERIEVNAIANDAWEVA